jgi:hypothetical protein
MKFVQFAGCREDSRIEKSTKESRVNAREFKITRATQVCIDGISECNAKVLIVDLRKVTYRTKEREGIYPTSACFKCVLKGG